MNQDTDISLWLSGLQLAGPDMLVDEYEQYNNDRQDVVNISPDDAFEEPAEAEPMADDCRSPSASPKPFQQLAIPSAHLISSSHSTVYPSHPASLQRLGFLYLVHLSGWLTFEM